MCVCRGLGHACVSVSPSLNQVHGSAVELLSQTDPWECREFLPDAPGHSAPAAPFSLTHTQACAHTHTHKHPPPPPFNPNTIDRHSPKSRHLALHTYTHPGELQGKSGISRNTLEKQEKAEGTRCKIVLNKKEREVQGKGGKKK